MGSEAGDPWKLGEQASLVYVVVLRPRQWTSTHMFKDKVSSARHNGPYAYNPRTWGTLKTASSVWGQLWLHTDFQASLRATTVPTPAETCTWQSEQGTQQTYWEQKESTAVWDRRHPSEAQKCDLKTQVLSVSYASKIQSTGLLPRNVRFQWIDAQGWHLDWTLLPGRTENNLNAHSLKWYHSKKIEYSSYVLLH